MVPESENTVAWRSLVAEATQRLAEVSADPAIDARRIVEAAGGFEPSEYAISLDELVTNRGMAKFDTMVARRLKGEPLQYVVGSWSFRELDLFVDSRVLIPRPETEGVAGLALDECRALQARRVADLGTGSGAIALSLAWELRDQADSVEVWASDVSTEALVVARANLATLGRVAAGVRMVEGSWFEALPTELRGTFDVIVSNPPYIGDDEVIETVVADWEPASALFAGPDGTRDLQVIIPEALDWLTPTGSLVMEMAPQQTAAARDLALSVGFVDAVIHHDLSGRARTLVAKKC